jgi:hypothetical protein
MTTPRCGYPYIVVVERELVPRTVLGWGVCLRLCNFTVWKTKTGGLRMEVSSDAPADAVIARRPEDLPESESVSDLLRVALLVDMGKDELPLWAGALDAPSTGRGLGFTID